MANDEELYLEILYHIISNISRGYVYISIDGCEVEQTAMLSYIQEAFNVSNDKHDELLIRAKAKQFPELLLSVEVIEGKDLVPDESRSACHVFVSVYLTSEISRRYNTSVQLSCNPSWEEYCSIPVPGVLTSDSLCLEVWCSTEINKGASHIMLEGEAIKKLSIDDITDIESMKRQNKLSGKANMPLKYIPVGDFIRSLSLCDENGKSQGTLKVRCSFSLHNDLRLAVKEYRRLFRKLLLHELVRLEATATWCGDFSPSAEAILTEYVAQTGISQVENWLTHWFVYCSLVAEHPINFSLFVTLSEKISDPLQSGVINDEGANFFWEGAKYILHACFQYIKLLRNANVEEEITLKTLTEALTILNKLSLIVPPGCTDLFSGTLYGWLTYKENGTRLSIKEVLHQVVTQTVSDWFVHILDNNEFEDKTEEARLEHLIKVIKSVRSDLRRAVYYDTVFEEVMSFPYSKVVRGVLGNKITILMEPKVILVCQSLRWLRRKEESPLNENSNTDDSNDVIGNPNPGEYESDLNFFAMGPTLFELYLALKSLKQDIEELGWKKDTELKLHLWFCGGVTLWLDMAAFKAVMRIDRAVDLDDLVPVAPNVSYSSSSVDTIAIFYQVYETFWQQLAWPVDEDSFAFVTKVVDDVCRCCMFYSEKMSSRLETVEQPMEELFQVTPQHCVTINNIGFVHENLAPFIAKLGTDDIIRSLCHTRISTRSEICRYRVTLQNLIENAKDTVSNKIVGFLDALMKKIMACFMKLLVSNAELLQSDCSSVDTVMRYLEANFNTLHENLNIENFTTTLGLFWDLLGEALYKLIQENLEKHRPPIFFRNVHKYLPVMEQSFRQDDKELQKTDTLKCVEYLLKNHGTETKDLIHQHHLHRWQDQQALSDPEMSLITVRAQFDEEHLWLEIMNARQLTPINSNGFCNSYVKIMLLPRHLFSNIKNLKTQIQHKSLFPLYDEEFIIPLSPEQRSIQDALVHIVVKDKDTFNMRSTFLGEAYLHFNEVKHAPGHSSLPQRHLPLSGPNGLEMEIIEILEIRKTDKEAREFLTKQRQKLPIKKSPLVKPILGIPEPLAKFLPRRVVGSIVSLSLHSLRNVSKNKKGTS